MSYNEDIAARLMQDLMNDFELTRDQAAGVVGNLAFETTGFRDMQEKKPTVKGSRGGYGYAHWTGKRRRDFEAFAEAHGLDIDSYEANYGFLAHDLRTEHAYSLNHLRRAKTPHEATEAFANHYEYPGTPHMDRRKKLSMDIYMNQNLGFEAPTPTPRPDPGSVTPQRTPGPDSGLRSPQRAPRPAPGFEAQPRSPLQNPGLQGPMPSPGPNPGFQAPIPSPRPYPDFQAQPRSPMQNPGFQAPIPTPRPNPGFQAPIPSPRPNPEFDVPAADPRMGGNPVVRQPLARALARLFMRGN